MSPSFESLAAAGAAWGATWTVHAVVAALLAWFGLRIVRASDAVREIAWRAALLIPAVTASLQCGLDMGPTGLTLGTNMRVTAQAPTNGASRILTATSDAPGGGGARPSSAGPRTRANVAVERTAPPIRREDDPSTVEAPAWATPDSAAGRESTNSTEFDPGEWPGEPAGSSEADVSFTSESAIGGDLPSLPERTDRPVEWTSRRDDEWRQPIVPWSGPSVDLGPRADTMTVAPEPAAASGRSVQLLLVAGGLLAALLGLARLGLQRIRLQRLLDDRRPVTDPAMLAAAARLAERAGLRAAPRLTLSARLDSPVAWGVLRPEVCMPQRAISDLAPASRDAMLAHEIAHHLRRDPLWLEFAHAVTALVPWHPLPHLARRQLAALAEFRCDVVAAQLVGPVPLAECMVEVASWSVASRRGVPLGVVAGMALGTGGLEERVDRVLEENDHARPAPRRVVTAGTLALVVCGATTALPAVRPAPALAGADPAMTAPAMTGPAASERISSAPDAASAEPVSVSEALPVDALGDASTDAPLGVPSDAETVPADAMDVAPTEELLEQLPVLLDVVAVEHELLVLQIEAVRAELEPSELEDPEIAGILAELELRLDSLEGRRMALEQAAQQVLDAGIAPAMERTPDRAEGIRAAGTPLEESSVENETRTEETRR